MSTLGVPKTLPPPPPPPLPLLNLGQPIVDELIMDIFLQLVIFLDENFPELKQVFEQHKVIYCKLFYDSDVLVKITLNDQRALNIHSSAKKRNRI